MKQYAIIFIKVEKRVFMCQDTNIELIFIQRLEELVNGYGKQNQEGVKAALRYCQDEFSCISISHQEQIANAFDVKFNIVKTFIKLNKSFKESIVENEIICCSGPRCSNKGALSVLNTVMDELSISINQTTADGKIRLSTQNCFKQCKFGPNMMLNGKLYHNMDSAKAKALIKGLKSK